MPENSSLDPTQQRPWYWTRQGVSLQAVEERFNELLELAGPGSSITADPSNPGLYASPGVAEPGRLVSVDANTKLPSPAVQAAWADGFIEPAVEDAVPLFAAPKTALYLAGTGSGNEATAIQSVLDAAGADEIVRLYGTFSTSSTITVKGNLDASGAVINYSGTGVAVQVGLTSAVTWRKQIILPRVVHTGKSGTGWASVSGTTGVLLVNLNSCPLIVIPHVQNFETGVIVRGDTSKGIVYNTINIGHLDNNKVNQRLDAVSSGWTNQNTYVGGRFSHETAEGSSVSGVRHIQIATGLASSPNNNQWLNPSLENDTPEYQVEISGQSNQILNGRWEVTGGARIWFRADAQRNQILYGYSSDSIVVTTESGAIRNHVMAATQWSIPLAGTSALLTENSTSSTNPALNVMEAGGIAAGASPATAYAVALGAKTTSFKRAADTNPRIQVDGENARLYFGSGSAALARYLGNLGTSAISVNGGNLSPGANNTLDLGQASFLWRYIRAGTAVVTGAAATGSRPSASTAGAGAMFYDTTLSKPIWSDGTSWKDATGTTV